ncbi:MAG: short-chain fatty acyl-CoA regulator family protein [Aestuariivita sp.]|nr:short-chain fatty acyl-CoA regulator family protein [Aestuariivita sp.]
MKVFIGPRLRQLRKKSGDTQAQMAQKLRISTSYVNLLEKNERSVSVPVLLNLLEAYGVDWRDIAQDEDTSKLADLRAALQDPLFVSDKPDLTQLRAALSHSPEFSNCFLRLHRAYLAATDQLMTVAEAGGAELGAPRLSPEAAVHIFFRHRRNYFPELEISAEKFWNQKVVAPDDIYAAVKSRLLNEFGIRVHIVPVERLSGALREYNEVQKEVILSEALDHPNRIFQLVHVCGLIEQRETLEHILSSSGVSDSHGKTRCKVELANYFAAAVLMPYQPFLDQATEKKYDFARLSAQFGVSFEQACHRATTLQRPGAQGVPFFFFRIDKAGNVTKRFNATDFHLAEYGGACPRLDVHTSFRNPGQIDTQYVEMPDRSRFFVFSRTVDRPVTSRHEQDLRLAIAMGCSLDHVGAIGYAEGIGLADTRITPIGINCRICPRKNCDQRAHSAVILTDPIDTRRRGATRYDN